MKGVIETTQTSGIKTIIPIQNILFIQENGASVEVVFELYIKKYRVTRGVLTVVDSFEEIKAKIEAAF